jgi:4-hydroxyphenylacetate 3-monooxygenase
MPARDGAAYLARLRERPPNLWMAGERVTDPTTHPGLAGGARSMAALYDQQMRPEIRASMTFPSPSSGEPVGMSFLVPRSAEDLRSRHTMMARWAGTSFGMMGRTPDYLNSVYMAFGAAHAFFAAREERLGHNVRNYHELMREQDLCSTHTLINPQANRAVGPGGQKDPFLAAGIVRETDRGLLVRGARMLATLGPLSDEIAVFPSTVLKAAGPDADRYAFAFAVPTDLPGLKLQCRESFDLGRPHFDHPLGSRFEEMDCVVFFEDAEVPWERVFLYRDVERCNQLFAATGAVGHMTHQVVVKNVAKAEFMLGLVALITDTIGVGEFQHVQEKVAECICYLEVMRACLRAAEADAALDEHGVFSPAWWPLNVARNLFPKWYPRMVEIVQQLGASGLMATPGLSDLEGPLGPEIARYLQAAGADARDRLALFHLAWDVACSSFGGRQALYERFFFGDPVRMAGALAQSYDKGPAMERVREFLAQGLREEDALLGAGGAGGTGPR